LSWSICTLPANGVANSGCTDGTGRGLTGLGSGTTIGMTMPDVDPALLGPPDATNGLYLPIVLHAAAGSDQVDAVYRLRLRVPQVIAPGCELDPPYLKHCEPNTNPSYSAIFPLDDEGSTTVTTKGQIWGLYPEYAVAPEEYAIPDSPEPTVFEIFTT